MVPSDRTRQHQRNILKSLRQGDLLRIKGNQPFKSPDVYHVFVVLNINPAKDELLLVAGILALIARAYLVLIHIS